MNEKATGWAKISGKEKLFLAVSKNIRTFAVGYITYMDSQLTKQISDYFATQPVLKAWVFGSYARGEQRDNSDIDILVQFDHEHAKIGLFKYSAMILDLERLLHREVDLVEDGQLLPFAERTANKDKKLIYERASA